MKRIFSLCPPRLRGYFFCKIGVKVDFKCLKGMFDALSFERQKEFPKTFIEKVVIDPEWFEIHYVPPSGMGVDHLLLEGGGDDDGNGGRPDGGGNGAGGSGNRKKSARIFASSTSYKNRTCGNGVSDKNPGQNSVSDFCGHDDNAPRLGAYRKTGKNGGAAATAPKNGKSKNPQETKPISAVAEQQLQTHHSSYGKSGEGTPLWYIRRNVCRERWNHAWRWNGNVIAAE